MTLLAYDSRRNVEDAYGKFIPTAKAHLAALNRFTTGIQALFPNLRNGGLLVAGERPRNGSSGYIVRLGDDLNRQVRLGQMPLDVLHDATPLLAG